MMDIDVTKYSYEDLKAMDLWVGENIWSVRPKEPPPYIFDTDHKQFLRV